jgi:UDP-N-acetylglucosamine 4,6-dehydratase
MTGTLTGSTVLITGGTGSFGQTMAKRLLATDCAEIRIFSRDEAKQDEMRHRIPDERLRFYVGDVRAADGVDRVVRGSDLIFHAAALKQVPSCEFFPVEAVRTNIMGSENVIEAAERHGTRSVVCLSTDKAVYPINAMGMSKAMMEKVAQAHARNNRDSRTVVSIVRYGNVMYSRGSVLPLFVRQVRSGQPLTVTDPLMTRFMMSLTEAVGLVEFAFEHARPGDLFVRKAPAATMGDVARAVSSLFGSEAEPTVIGTRHGEKLFETLASREELTRAEDLGDYYRVPVDDRDLNYGLYFTEGQLAQATVDDYTSHNTQRLSLSDVVDLLRSLPEIQAELVSA